MSTTHADLNRVVQFPSLYAITKIHIFFYKSSKENFISPEFFSVTCVYIIVVRMLLYTNKF